MRKAVVRFLPEDVTAEATLGSLLLDVALEAGIFLPASCGGAGSCGRCKVKVTEGSVEALALEKLHAEDRAAGFVLACQSRVTGDVTVEIPRVRGVRKVLPRDEAERMRLTATPMESPIIPQIDPVAFTVLVSPPPAVVLDNVSDLERVIRTLRKDHQIAPVTAGLEIARELPTVLRRDDDWKISACLRAEQIPDSPGSLYRIYRILSGHLTAPPTAVAVDIGTTSLWGELVNLDTGAVLARASRYNPQISMGDDVISRIVYALKKDGLNKLQERVTDGLNQIVTEILEKSGQPREAINFMVAAGNTVMTHLFLGLYPKFLRESPYVPAAQNVEPVPARDLGVDIPPQSPVMVFPGVASYVGGDIVSGVLANGMWNSDEMTLFIDIGTNGEIVAGNRELMMTASCSAGPAF